jgi:hypothetical protein
VQEPLAWRGEGAGDSGTEPVRRWFSGQPRAGADATPPEPVKLLRSDATGNTGKIDLTPKDVEDDNRIS